MKHLPNIIVGLSFLVILIAGTYQLSESPGIWYDEGMYLQSAMNLAEYGRESLQTAPGTFVSAAEITVGYPLLAPVALSYTLFGVSVLSARSVMVLFMFGLAAVAYLLIRRLSTPMIAALSLAVLASSPLLYGNGKSMLGEVPGIMLFLGSLLALHALEKSNYRSLGAYFLTGLLAGLAFASKPLFALVPISIFATYLILLLIRKIPVSLAGFIVGLVGFLLPVALWLVTQFGPGDTLSSMIAYYLNPYEISDVGSTVFSNLKRFVTEFRPAYTLGGVLLWAAALFVRARYKRERLPAAEVGAFVFCISVLLAYTRLNGWYRYISPTAFVAFLFLPGAIVTLYAWVAERWKMLARLSITPFAVVGLLALAQLTQIVHGSYVADYYGSHRTRDTTTALAALPEGASVFFYDVPELVILAGGRPYYQYIEPHPHQRIGEESLELLSKGKVPYVMASGAAYSAHPELFTSYRKESTVNRYVVLTAL